MRIILSPAMYGLFEHSCSEDAVTRVQKGLSARHNYFQPHGPECGCRLEDCPISWHRTRAERCAIELFRVQDAGFFNRFKRVGVLELAVDYMVLIGLYILSETGREDGRAASIKKNKPAGLQSVGCMCR